MKIEELSEGLRAGDPRVLSKAITLIESRRPEDAERAVELLSMCSDIHSDTHRIAVTGIPGVGKSTFIESIGRHFIEQGKKVAVLAIDPSSAASHGSILGDKTRMQTLSTHPSAFIRPSSAADTLGGVARMTREAMMLCEAAGYDVIIIETVGVGQSETVVKTMVDTFILLMISGAGDELQGIKRGITELADIMVINKAEEERLNEAQKAVRDYSGAMDILQSNDIAWRTKIDVMSSLTGYNREKIIKLIDDHHEYLISSGAKASKRNEQNVTWFETMLAERVLERFYSRISRQELETLKDSVIRGEVDPFSALKKALEL